MKNKHRGKRVDTGEWVYGYYGYKETTGQHFIMIERAHIMPRLYGSYFVDVEVDPKTVGQSTGLKVKDGTEIFAGDVIEESASVDVCHYHVVWNETDATFEFVVIGTGETFYASDLYLDNSEIIGNSTDNPELLEGTV